jgi:hypothetical protein
MLCKKRSMLQLIGMTCIFVFVSLSTKAEESIEYHAEHLLEVPMGTRILAFPTTPLNTSASETRLQAGYTRVAAGKLSNSVSMFGAQHYLPLNNSWGLLISGFYDRSTFSGENGKAIGGVLFVDAPEVPNKFDIDITNVSGSSKYTGASLALTYAPGGLWRWQLGYAQADLNVEKFAIRFNTQNLANNFSGSVDYAHRYKVNTLFGGLEMAARDISENITYSPHFIIVKNFPHVGFSGRVTGPDFDYSGDTTMTGRGKHIPDGYFGIGVNVEHKTSGLRVDLGATLFTFALEPIAHKGTRSPIFLNLSLPIF